MITDFYKFNGALYLHYRKKELIYFLISIVFNFAHGLLHQKYIKEDIYFEIVEPESLHYTFKVRPAQDFGVRFNRTLNHIGLFPSEPSHGCSAPMNRFELQNNIVLMDRGGCSFLSKCVQAERSGVLAVIVCDTDITNDEIYVDMIDDTTKRNCSIPAMFLLGKDGFMIKKTLHALNLRRAIINIPLNVTNMQPYEQRLPPWVLW